MSPSITAAVAPQPIPTGRAFSAGVGERARPSQCPVHPPGCQMLSVYIYGCLWSTGKPKAGSRAVVCGLPGCVPGVAISAHGWVDALLSQFV